MLAVHFGAGNIGRGFIGQLLSQAGYDVCFVDVNDKVVHEINQRGEYSIQLANKEQRHLHVRHVKAINGKEEEAVREAIVQADLVTTAIGPNILPFIAPTLAKGMEKRIAVTDKPLNVIACENMIGGSQVLRGYVYQHLAETSKLQVDRQIGFPNTAVDRVVPLQKNDDPLLVITEEFYEWVIEYSNMVGCIPEIPGVTLVERLDPYIERKLFTVNAGHAAVAYLGYFYQYRSISEALGDSRIIEITRRALDETGQVLIKRHGFAPEKHQAYIDKIIERFKNPYISDAVTRVGRSPLRKLAPADRLVSPALAAIELEIEPSALSIVIAAALFFDYPNDPEAVELQTHIQEKGVESALKTYLQLSESGRLYQLVLQEYNSRKG